MPDTGSLVERTPLQPGDLLQNGLFTIRKMLGEGGFALTYLAEQGPLRLPVCIKEFFPLGAERGPDGIRPSAPPFERRLAEGMRAFLQEAQTLERFHHPSIVRVLAIFPENNTAYLVQELLEGMTLADGLALASKMKEPAVLKVAQQLGQALLMVHGAGLVHADLKPANVFLTREGRYVLLDFGLTRGFLSRAAARQGGRGLSPGYAPPEQYSPQATLTPAADVYGLGATLFTLLAGMPPPEARARCEGTPLPALEPMSRGTSQRTQDAIVSALTLDEKARTPGIRELLHQLGLDSSPKAIAYRPPAFQSVAQAGKVGLVRCLDLDAQVARLYSGGQDGWLRVWSWPGLELLGGMAAYDAPVCALALSASGEFLVTGSEGGEVKLFATDLSTPGHLLLQESSEVTSLVFASPEVAGATFASGLCCLASARRPALRWMGHQGPANRIDGHPSGLLVVTTGDDTALRFWRLEDGELLRSWAAHDKIVQSVRFSHGGTCLLTASNDHLVRCWDLATAQVLREFPGHQAVVLDARASQDGKLIFTLAGDRCLRAFSMASSRVSCLAADVDSDSARALAVDPGRPLVATGGARGIRVWSYGP